MKLKEKRVEVHKLMLKLGVIENKPDILAGYGVESTTELSDKEIDELMDRLRAMYMEKCGASGEVRHWRSNVLTLLNNIGIYATNGDWSRVNKFMLDKRIAGKLLYEMSVDEMKELCRKLRAIANKTQEYNRKAFINEICKN